MKTNLTWASAVIVAGLTLVPALSAQVAKKLLKGDPEKQSQQEHQDKQAKLIADRSKKLAKPVFEKANWLFDYDEARAEAERSGKLLFAYFTRSYSY